MSTDFSNISQIDLPNYSSTVKKIEDANGNLIWGDPTTYPFQKLEYIQTNGTQVYTWASSIFANDPSALGTAVLTIDCQYLDLSGSYTYLQGRLSSDANNGCYIGVKTTFSDPDGGWSFFAGSGGKHLVGTADTDRHTFGIVMANATYNNESGPGYILDGVYTHDWSSFRTFSAGTAAGLYLLACKDENNNRAVDYCEIKFYNAHLKFVSGGVTYYYDFYPMRYRVTNQVGILVRAHNSSSSTYQVGFTPLNNLVVGPITNSFWMPTDEN